MIDEQLTSEVTKCNEVFQINTKDGVDLTDKSQILKLQQRTYVGLSRRHPRKEE